MGNKLRENEFKITCAINKAFTVEKDGVAKRYVSGKASGTDVDRDMEQMAVSAVQAFKKAIDEGITLPDGSWSLIPLFSMHEREWEYHLGYIVGAEVDKNNELWVTAELEDDNPKADLLYSRLTKKKEDGKPAHRLGLSVGGMVLSAGHEWNEEYEAYLKTYYQVALLEVSVTSEPSYPTAFLNSLGKNVNWDNIKGRTRLVSDDELQKRVNEVVLMHDESKETDDMSKNEEKEVVETPTTDEVTKETTDEETPEQVEKTDAVEDAPSSEEVEKSEEAKVEIPTDSQITELQKSLSVLAEDVAKLTIAVADLMERPAEEEETTKTVSEPVAAPEETVTKAEEVVEEETVEKTDTSDDDLLAKVAGVVKTSVAESIASLEKRMEELESQEVDRSISVSKSKEDKTLDPLAEFEESVKDVRGSDIIANSLAHLKDAA